MDQNIINVEKEVMSCLLNTTTNFDKVFSLLSSSDFSTPEHSHLFQLLKDMYDEGKVPREANVINRAISTKNKYVTIELAQLVSDQYTTDAHIEDDIKLIVDASTKRQLSKLGDKLKNVETNGKADIRDTIADFEKTFVDITRNRSVGDFKNIGDVAKEVVAKAYDIRNSNISVTGTAVGFKALDEMTAGFQPGDLVIVAARPGMGKTALALNMLLNASRTINREECVVFFSLEMPEHQLVTRLLSAESMVDLWKFKKGQFNQKDMMEVEIAKDSYQDLNIKFDCTSGLEISDLANKVKTLSTYSKPRLIVVDYLQLLSARGYGSNNRQQEVSAISRKLKILGGEIGCPIIALSQLSRNVESREDKRPMLSDLRESGAIEQDADMILFMYRDEYYNKNEEAPVSDTSIVEVNIAKNRHGAQEKIKLMFQKNCMRFDNL